MPEGPEVRKYADALDAALTGRVITSLEARTKEARKWLQENEQRIVGRRVARVISHGKHLMGYIEGRFFFHSHLMMWGRWQTFGIELPEKDRRERARIVVEGAAAILLSAPIFNVGEGDPYEVIEILGTLGPDALPYRGPFNRTEFLRRLLEFKDETIGAALLNQRIVAGLGNYLRAEIVCPKRFRVWLAMHTNAPLPLLKKIAKEWRTIRRWSINPAANTAPGTWSFGARTCHVCAVASRFDNSGKGPSKPTKMTTNALASFTFVQSVRKFL